MPPRPDPSKGLNRRIMFLLNTIPFAPTTPMIVSVCGTRRSSVWKQLERLERVKKVVRFTSLDGPTRWASMKWATVYFHSEGYERCKPTIAKEQPPPPAVRVRSGKDNIKDSHARRKKLIERKLQDFDSVF